MSVRPTVLAGMVLHPLEKAREALKFYREYNSKTADEMSAWAALLTSPDGHPMVAILACYIGPSEAGEKVVRLGGKIPPRQKHNSCLTGL